MLVTGIRIESPRETAIVLVVGVSKHDASSDYLLTLERGL